jgi:hypothetical protein
LQAVAGCCAASIEGIFARELPNRVFQKAVFIAKLIFSTALLVWIVATANLRDVVDALSDANLGWFALAACMPAVGTCITAVRWKGLLQAQGFRMPLRGLIGSCMVAKFVGLFLPSTIAGDAIRAFDTWKAGANKSVAITALVVDRLSGLLVLALFGVFAICLPQEITRRFPVIYGCVGIGAVGLLVCVWCIFAPSARFIAAAQALAARLPERVRSLIEQPVAALAAYRGRTGALVQALLLSTLLQINVVTFYYFIGRTLGLEISYDLYYIIVPIAVFVMLAPISINGIGVRESIFVFLLGIYSVDDARAVAFAWVEYGTFTLYGLFGGFVYALRKTSAARSTIDFQAEHDSTNAQWTMETEPAAQP